MNKTAIIQKLREIKSNNLCYKCGEITPAKISSVSNKCQRLSSNPEVMQVGSQIYSVSERQYLLEQLAH